MPPVRPHLKPALRRIWRDRTTLQLGSDPETAVVITGLDEQRARLVERFDGTSDVVDLRRTAVRMGLDATVVDDLVSVLGESGALQESARRSLGSRPLDPAERDRLAPDVAAASLVDRAPDAAPPMARRRESAVTVHGGGRVGATVAALLASAGVGTVVIEDAATTRPGDVCPAGLHPGDVGSRRQEAVVRRLRRLAPSIRTSLPSGAHQPDLAVVAADDGWPDPHLGDRLVRAGVPHLVAAVRETTGVVGPFVIPGRTSCQRCLELHRTDRDAAWPSVSAQLVGRSGSEPVCDVALATSVAASAVLMVLAYLEQAPSGWPLPLAADGTVEISQATGRVRRRTWSRHPACGCGWLPEALGL